MFFLDLEPPNNGVDYEVTVLWDASQDISTWDAIAEVKKHPLDPTLYYTMTVGSGHITLDADGQVTFTISDTFSFRYAVYDLVLIEPGGATHLAGRGQFLPKIGVTTPP